MSANVWNCEKFSIGQSNQYYVILFVLCLLFFTGCNVSSKTETTQITLFPTSTATVWTETPTPTNTPTKVPTSIPTLTPSVTSTSTPSPTSTSKPTATSTEPKPANTPEPSGWDRYIPRKMPELISMIETEVDLTAERGGTIYMEMDPSLQFPSKIKVGFTGEYRKVNEPRFLALTGWLYNFAPQLSSSEREDLVDTEALFKVGSQEYWLPVQKPLIAFMQDEVAAGRLEVDDKVYLLIQWIGATKIEGEIEYIFLVNAVLNN